jgi:hypothetical protein
MNYCSNVNRGYMDKAPDMEWEWRMKEIRTTFYVDDAESLSPSTGSGGGPDLTGSRNKQVYVSEPVQSLDGVNLPK